MNKILKISGYAFAVLLVFGLQPHLSIAQSGERGEVSGSVFEYGTQDPISYATVSIFEESSEELVTGGITDMDGEFSIGGLEDGSYFLRVNFIGYEVHRTEAFELRAGQWSREFSEILLRTSSQELEEVVVSEQRSSFETRIDRRIFNVENDIVSEGGDAIDVLSNVPSVEVDVDDNITLRGDESVRILIDGRPSTFSAAEVLRQIPANSIERIELITNPSARFDPEGMAGIINIVLKKDSNLGFNGNVNLSYGRGVTDKYSGSVGLNLRNSNVNIFGNYSYRDRSRYSDGFSESFINFPDTTYSFAQDDVRNRNDKSHNIRAGMDYFLDDNNTLYFSGSLRTSERESDQRLDINYFNANEVKTIESMRNTTGDGSNLGFEFNTGWQKKFANPDNTLDIDLVYSKSSRDRDREFAQDFFSLDDVPIGESAIQSQERENMNELFSGRADFEFQLPTGWAIETGTRVDLTRLDNALNSFDIDPQSGEKFYDENLSNHFLYEQDVMAGYFLAGRESGNWQYKLGVRAEQTFTGSELLTTGETFENNYFSLFPSAFLGYSLSEGQDILLSYSRRINRPRTRQINPFRDLSDPNNFRTGNPELRPEYTDAFELTHVRIWEWLTLNNTIYYRQTNDLIRRYLTFEEEGVTVTTFENLGRSHSYGYEMVANIRPYRWWNINTTFNLYGQRLDDSELTSGLNRSSDGYTVRLSSNKTLAPGTSVQVSGRYRSGFTVPQGEIKPFFNIDLAVRRNFLNDQLTVSLNARDVFNTLRFRFSTLDDIPIVRTMERNWESRVVTLNATYRFGSRYDGPERRQQRRNGGDDRFTPPDIE